MLLVGLTAMAGGGRATAQCHYTYTVVPNPPGGIQQCYAAAINNHGHVAGYVGSLSENSRAFIWTPESGTFVLPLPPGVYDMRVLGLNDVGQVCGWMNAPGGGGYVAFIWSDQGYTVIERPAWVNTMEAHAINNAGRVVGFMSNVVTGPQHAFVWQDGTIIDLGLDVSTGYSQATDVNERDEVVGYAWGADAFHLESFVWDGVDFLWLTHPDGLDSIRVAATSNNGFGAGRGTTNEPLHNFGIVWTPWGTEVFASPPEFRDARLTGVNDAGRAVGFYDRLNGGSGSIPIVWQSGAVADLRPLVRPTAPQGLRIAHGINNGGQIVATYHEGTVILNPVWLPGDLTGDCHVGMEDLALVLSNFGAPVGSFPLGDVNADGEVDLADLAILLGHWGE